ncbi:uncharacterized protein LOC110724258 [Chenopodium quinoa]|uniref:uncharacterized protein LOC110724258 n=1 Tax=Chenopodium quinoa TaxID=63459 RepID=UPI000B78A3BE|nr:uncharacterized protein LOC110724258 [Chenopodium quinoa]
MVIYIREKKSNLTFLFPRSGLQDIFREAEVTICRVHIRQLICGLRALLIYQNQVVGSKKVKKSTTWSKIQCPRQTNGVDFGYYVLRFMRDIIAHNQPQIPEMYFSDCLWPNYSTEQIDEVKTELARHILYFAS